MEGFDLRTHIRDAKTGNVKKLQPYRLRIKNGVKIFERGGKFFYEDGSEVQKPEVKAESKEKDHK